MPEKRASRGGLRKREPREESPEVRTADVREPGEGASPPPRILLFFDYT